ncbi:hypothetical protein [Planctomyces sp. SH-PL14]|uniref:hypothetical protein n=1 Tax=Planctomyces sp. SH-PL14 TaxID=1632864 RepID=UPI00078B2C78|nr:hypothetical protein [Planctomyces sp. SH-PL14]AMV20047.1 hypothetical protein VT03_19285 [Planctomyces sp. SH-PL14]
MSRRIPGFLFALTFALLFCAAGALAQSPPPAPLGNPLRTESPAASPATPPTGGPTSESGLPTGRSDFSPLPTVLKPLIAAIDPEAPAPFHVSALKLDGVVTGDAVVFTVDIDVQINRQDSAYYDVPLRLSQGRIFEKKYDGPGKEGPAPATEGDDGLHWRFSGAGAHHLRLKMSVPIKRTGGTNSVALSLPQLPSFFDAQFRLTIRGKRILVRTPKETSISETVVHPDRTEVQGSVRGTRLEVNWSESAVDVPAISRVNTLMTLRHEADRLTLLGEQTVQRERTSVGEIFVRMPTAGQLLELASPHVRMHEPAPARPGWRRVVLQDAAPDRIDLRWSFDMPFPTAGGRVTVDGLEVAEARVQEGGVHLADFGTHLAIPRMSESPLIRRVDVANTRSAVPIVNAFEFVKQPFGLVLDIQKVQPRFSVRPAHWLLIREDEIQMESIFQIEVENGALSDLTVAWADARTEGWRIDTTSPGLLDLTPAEAETAFASGALPIRLRTPASSKVEVRLRFRRANPMGKDLHWTLPRISGGRPLPGFITVSGDDNVLPNVTPDPQATEDPHGGALLAAPAEFADLPRTTWRLAPRSDGVFKAAVSLKEREVDIGTTIGVSRQAGRGILVRQVLRYHVRFGRLQKIQVELPPGLAAQIPQGAEGAALSARLAGAPLETSRQGNQIQFRLPTPRIGEFEVALEYALPVETDAIHSVTVKVPILPSPDAAYSSVRCMLPDGEGLSIVDEDSKWEPIPTAPESTVWFSSKNPAEIPLRVTGSLRQESQRYSIETAFHHVTYDGTGASVTYSEFAFRDPPARIALTIPVNAEQTIFEWNDRPILESEGTLRTDPSLPGRFLIELGMAPAASGGRLRMIYRQPPAGKWRGGRMTSLRSVELPQFPPNVWINQSICELDLTRDDHLLQSPSAFRPEFSWRRQGAIWTRQPLQRYLDARSRYVTVDSFQGVDLRTFGYAYSGTGPVEQFSFTAMNRTLIVLIGAGLSLVLGFLFWRFPWTRNAQTFLIVAFLFSFLSLWLLEPIQVLLQPALLGAVLAVLASWIDTRTRPPEWPELSLPLPIPPAPVAVTPASLRDSRSHPSTPAPAMAATAHYQPAASHHDLGP